MAISVYHNPADLVADSNDAGRHAAAKSRIYIRHYTDEIDDTVCYVVPA